MTRQKTDRTLYILYCALWVLFSAVFIFEVPLLVFWAPTVLFGVWCGYSIYKKTPLRIPVGGVVLLVFCIAYVAFTYDPSKSIYYQSYTLLHCVFLFVIGYHFFVGDDPVEQRTKTLKQYLLIVALLYLLYIAVTYIYDRYYPLNVPEDRKYWSIWYPGTVTKAATGFCASMSFAAAWGSFMLFFAKKNLWKIFGAALVLICFVFNVVTGTRLMVLLIPVLLAGDAFLWLAFYKKKTRLAFLILGVFLLLCAGALLGYYFFKDALKQRFADSVIYRFVNLGLRSTRWKYMLNVLRNFSLTYLGGGVNTAAVGVPHNFWLYVYDFGGIVPFALYLVFTVVLIIAFIRMMKNRFLPRDLKFFLATLMVPIFAEFMLEDLFLGLPSFLHVSHFIFGVICGAAVYKPKQIPE